MTTPRLPQENYSLRTNRSCEHDPEADHGKYQRGGGAHDLHRHDPRHRFAQEHRRHASFPRPCAILRPL